MLRALPHRFVSGISVVGAVSALRQSNRCDRYVELPIADSVSDVAKLVAAVNEISESRADCVAVPGDVEASRMLLAGQDSLRCKVFPLPPRELLDVFDDKWTFYQLCVDLEVPTPKTQLIVDRAAFRIADVAAGMVVVKPTGERAGAGLVMVDAQRDYDDRIGADPAYPYSRLVAQQFIPGRDIDISILAVAGTILCCAVQVRVAGAVKFVEHAALTAAIVRLIGATGYTGLVHFDAREHAVDGSIWLIEANPRGWGSLNAARWCGLNFAMAGLAVALGREHGQPERLTRGSYPGFGRAVPRLMAPGLSADQRSYLREILSDPFEYGRLVAAVRDRM